MTADDVHDELEAHVADPRLQAMVGAVVAELGESREAVRGARVIASSMAMLIAGADEVGLAPDDIHSASLMYLLALGRALDQLPA